MARPSYAAELDKFVTEQLARAQAQAAQQNSEAYAQAAQAEEQAEQQAAPPPSAVQSDETALPYAPPRAPMPPMQSMPAAPAMPAAAPRRAPPPQGPAPGGYGSGYGAVAAPAPASAPMRSPAANAPTAVASAQRTPILNVAALDEEITRLQQMRVWLSDPLMCAVIDKFIGQRMGATERRQAYYTVAAGAVSLVIGWLLSAISPASVLVGLFHR